MMIWDGLTRYLHILDIAFAMQLRCEYWYWFDVQIDVKLETLQEIATNTSWEAIQVFKIQRVELMSFLPILPGP